MARAGSLGYELFTLAWLQKRPRRNLSSFQINDLQGRWLHSPPGNTTSILPKFRSPNPSVSSWYYRKRGPFFLQSGSRPSGYLSGIEWITQSLQTFGQIISAVKWPVWFEEQNSVASMGAEHKSTAEQGFKACSHARPCQPCWGAWGSHPTFPVMSSTVPGRLLAIGYEQSSLWFMTWVWT